ncbi:MAG: hypothetical protein HOK83_07800, partial [Rhodospirillaceae bacterium]|nr:hypothetical protein [Rhodospirillaceae bacterium]
MTSPEVVHAFGYPFDPPGHGFLFVGGRGLRIIEDGSDPLVDTMVELDGAVVSAEEARHGLGDTDSARVPRTAVVGYGS